jgi:CheY-like chemotaxis protein
MAEILVIEDDAAVRSVMVRALQREGHHVFEDAGTQLIDLDQFEKLDVLVTDVGLPGETGYQLAERCRNKWRDCEIILLSGHSMDDLARRGVPADASIVQKPIGVPELAQLVDKVLMMRAWRALRTDAE